MSFSLGFQQQLESQQQLHSQQQLQSQQQLPSHQPLDQFFSPTFNGTQSHPLLTWQSQRVPRRSEEWTSGSRVNSPTNLEAELDALHNRIEQAVADGLASVQRALVDLQIQIQVKLKSRREMQKLILAQNNPSQEAVTDFQNNCRTINRSLEAFTAHADNLSHIKLTLARVSSFVSPEGAVANLIHTKTDAENVANLEREHQVLRRELIAISDRQREALNVTDVQRRSQNGFNPTESLGLEIPARRFGEQGIPVDQTPTERIIYTDSMLCEDEEQLNKVLKLNAANRIPNATCFVFYLPPEVNNAVLRKLFMPYGTVLNAYVAMDKVTNRTRGFGFVDFSTPSEAQAAVASMDKFPLSGKFLSVTIKV